MTDSSAQQQPVLIPIHSDGEIPEWAMLEVNGELIVPKESPEGTENFADDSLIRPQDMELGAVDFIDEKPVMILGSHQLKGSVEELKQPFCVLKKQIDNDGKVSYAISGVVTRKLLFNQYPKIIMR